MTRLWHVCGSIESLQYFLALEEQERFDLVNFEALGQHWRRFLFGRKFDSYDDAERELLEFDTMPVPVFRIVDPAFRLDYWRKGRIYLASSRLRQAFDLTDTVIRYRDIDLDQSPSAVRAQKYQAFQVVPFADPIDWSRTAGHWLDVARPDGSISKRWFIVPPNPVGPPNRICWRQDFTPPAQLFRAAGTQFMLATDALADRVMRAGITDLMFQDLTSDLAQTELVLRQL